MQPWAHERACPRSLLLPVDEEVADGGSLDIYVGRRAEPHYTGDAGTADAGAAWLLLLMGLDEPAPAT